MNRLLAIISITMLLLISCGKKEKIVEVPVPTDCPPSAPTGVFSINLDATVEVCWFENPEPDVVGYDVYRGVSFYGDYDLIASVDANSSSTGQYCYEDIETAAGLQYFYAVVAFDEGGNQSDLSFEEVTGTPRPEGRSTIYSFNDLPGESGFDLSNPGLGAIAYNTPQTDFYFRVTTEPGREAGQLVAFRNGVDIQDFGFKESFESVNWAPVDGWPSARIVEAVLNHCYIVRLLEGDGRLHYAKLYIVELTNGFVTFRWAYQTAPDNRDLTPPASGRGTGNASVYRSGTRPGPNTEAMLAIDSAIPPIVERVTWTQDFESRQRTTM